MRALILLTAAATALLTLMFYALVNYAIFNDLGFVEAGRIVFTTNFGYYDYIILPSGIVAGTILFKKLYSNEFKKLLNFGLYTTLISSIFFSAFIFVYLEFINPDFFTELITLVKNSVTVENADKLSALKAGMLLKAQAIENSALYRSSYFYAFANLIVYGFLGAMASLVAASIFKKRAIA